MFERYAIYHTFDGALAERGAAWLGWDIAKGTPASQPVTPDVELPKITQRPRKYGFHATMKAPFFPAVGVTEDGLIQDFETLCATLKPVTLAALELQTFGRFLALAPKGDDSDLKLLAADVVKRLDHLRAPLREDDFIKRARASLSEQHIRNLRQWGYPHVMDDFRFHVTLTAPLKPAEAAAATQHAQQFFAPVLPAPFALCHLTLAGQQSDGTFVQITRLPLAG